MYTLSEADMQVGSRRRSPPSTSGQRHLRQHSTWGSRSLSTSTQFDGFASPPSTAFSSIFSCPSLSRLSSAGSSLGATSAASTSASAAPSGRRRARNSCLVNVVRWLRNMNMKRVLSDGGRGEHLGATARSGYHAKLAAGGGRRTAPGGTAQNWHGALMSSAARGIIQPGTFNTGGGRRRGNEPNTHTPLDQHNFHCFNPTGRQRGGFKQSD